MHKIIKPFFWFALALVVGFLPGMALAANGVVTPPNASDWNLYVYGNARVIQDILNGIKMLMVPSLGSTGFTSLLLLLATVGFVVLAIAAGFDPGKNLFKMFSYIMVVWFVTYGTTKLTANVVIVDLAQPMGSVSDTPRVTGAPALVVLPAALTSTIGKYFTTSFETYFTVPDNFKVGGSGAGQFNLFGKMMQEANQWNITSPPLKNSLSAYVANCVVPNLALGKISGQIMGPDGRFTTGYGLEALLNGTNMIDVLGTAQSKSLLTRYYAYDSTNKGWVSAVGSETAGMPTDDASMRSYSTRGVLVSCTTSFALFTADMKLHATAMLKASSDAWAKTGVMVPYETLMNTMLASASGRGGEQVANFSSPSGFIMQQSLINASNGAYRQAAAQTGNNELVQAAALTQAEISQKSTWSATFSVFNNMMGYVFTVLQAFIFAITPLIIVALFIPGMGKAIFVNYAQILVWLTLWQPMLSIINFIITLFGEEAISGVVTASGGVTMANVGAISSKTNDLMIAAQFLGTMTPLLSWGIVKGAMAFTEFISHGVGSSFASQAGASAATGNMNLNNMSMDSTSMNKFSTTMSSQVGTQQVEAFYGAGKGMANYQTGGSGTSANGSPVNHSKQVSDQLQSAIGEQKQVSEALNQMKSEGFSDARMHDWAAGKGASSSQMKAANMVLSLQTGATSSTGAGTSTNGGNVDQHARDAGAAVSHRTGAQVTMGGDIGLKTPLGGISGGVGGSLSGDETNAAGQKVSRTETGQTGSAADSKKSLSEGASKVVSASTVNQAGVSSDASEKAGHNQGMSRQEAVSQALGRSESITRSLQHAQSVTNSTSFNEGVNLDTFRDDIKAFTSLQGEMSMGMAELESRGNALANKVTAGAASTHAGVGAMEGANTAALGSLRGGASGHGPGQQMGAVASQYNQFQGDTKAAVAADTDALKAHLAATGGKVSTGLGNAQEFSKNPLDLAGTNKPSDLTNANAPKPGKPSSKLASAAKQPGFGIGGWR